mmetsp:Transcript_25134/g.39463  ORF Transcript_25134/g.39463 Transcript_25134/m.39463 type:complete len:273 (+) Transcript_25134:291-1109(+)|eukprot:CAMPEP_0184319934 /NCGR_PEP_ID=MMETSP1049-20130417/111411_1 /TAXON_ID=77928 /ORGANISM="Proteomonas sulcata, Strain CCMP704" /LENGTH=272 /DNA_ID=CAMNT_0026640277 /DNA_START=283 /DNA_END=1101 /DNA_ORIENTATION=+
MAADAGDWVANLFGCTIARAPKNERAAFRKLGAGGDITTVPARGFTHGRGNQFEEEVQGGVGLVLVKDPASYFYIYLILKDSPAHNSRKVKQGDILFSINGKDIGHANEMPALSGPHGSIVTLGFHRPESGRSFDVILKRAQKAFPDQLSLPPPGYEFPSLSKLQVPQVQSFPEAKRYSPQTTAYNWSDGPEATHWTAQSGTSYVEAQQSESSSSVADRTPYGNVEDLLPSRYFQGAGGHATLAQYSSQPEDTRTLTIPEDSDNFAVERMIV